MTRDELQAMRELVRNARVAAYDLREVAEICMARPWRYDLIVSVSVSPENATTIVALIDASSQLLAEVERLQMELAAARIAALAYQVLSEVCRECEGTGEVDSGAPTPEGGDYYTVTCPSCNGTGKPFFGDDLSPERIARLQRYVACNRRQDTASSDEPRRFERTGW